MCVDFILYLYPHVCSHDRTAYYLCVIKQAEPEVVIVEYNKWMFT